jgi:hypothetical protein
LRSAKAIAFVDDTLKRRWPDPRAIVRMRRCIVGNAKTRRMTMKNPLDSIWGTIISGLILTAILYCAVRTYLM